MILEHEIPNGSKLYFGKSAKLKREIESVASAILDEQGFEEIVTPVFSYHQHLSIASERKLIRVNDERNNSISLRADSTIDVVRLIEKRLGRNTNERKWFYIQPVYKYPTTEQYQIGVEYIGETNLSYILDISNSIFKKLDVDALVQVSNMRIPQILVDMFEDLTLDDFRHLNVEKFLNLKVDWLTKLVYLQHVEQVDELLEVIPDVLKPELIKMKELCGTSCQNSVLAPMYYAKMLYYDELFFRVIKNNDVYARGGRYKSEDTTSVGFAIYTDVIIEEKVQ